MRPPLVCATITATNMRDLRRRRDAVRGADLVELRLDAVEDLDVAGALSGRHIPAVVTCRPQWEGGLFRGSEAERHRILETALAAGAEHVDIEWAAGFDDLLRHDQGRRVVLSMHDFDGIPSDLQDRVAAMRATGAAVIKIAVTAARLADCLRLPRPGPAAASKTIVIAMGPSGVATRILAGRFGSPWVYAGDAAPGQVSLSDLLGLYRFREIGAATTVYGLAGAPLGHSLSPAMHNAALAALNIDAIYLPLATTSADDLLEFADGLGLAGASVTAPLKVDVARRLAGLDEVAARVGAVNTIWRSARGWVGSNTDVAGFLAPLRDIGPLRGLQAAIVGAGGAARAAAVALGDAGAHVTVCARRLAQARDVADLASGSAREGCPVRGSWDLLINATPIGTSPDSDATPVPAECLTGRIVYDMVYNPPVTRLLREARAAGCRTVSGLDMLVAQAVRQVERWTGLRPDEGLMRTAAVERLAELAAATRDACREERHARCNKEAYDH